MKTNIAERSSLLASLVLLTILCSFNAAFSQSKKILVDVAHGQKFYSDPADKISTQLVPTDRLAYMTGELAKNASANNASLNYLKTPITAAVLDKNDLLFIHAAGTKYTPQECNAIGDFVKKGGSLFIVMEEDYWGTHEQLNINDIVAPFGITFKSNNPTKVSGGHSKPGAITRTKYSIPSHGARLVEGGTPFAFTNAPDETPIGVYTEIDGGGKIIAMGEGMVSLYMNEWQNVNDYQCAGFMEEVIGWLLK